MVELCQANMTHSSATSRSRFDRLYTNQHTSEQLDRKLTAVTLEWVPNLSNHRAVFFSRTRPHRLSEDERQIQPHIIKHKDFPRRVALHYQEKIKDHSAGSGIQKLVLLKEAMREVARHPTMPQAQPTEHKEDYLALL